MEQAECLRLVSAPFVMAEIATAIRLSVGCDKNKLKNERAPYKICWFTPGVSTALVLAFVLRLTLRV